MIKQEQLDEVLRFIERFCDENGYAPSVREICKEMGFKSTATAYNYIDRLRANGMLQKTDNKKRAVSLQRNLRTVPLLGTVTAGTPILATENYEGYYALPADEFKGDGIFMLRVQGDSMIGAGILDGDYVIAERTPTAENGEIVVGMIDDEATVKRFYRENGTLRLQPENPDYEPIISDEITILGKVIAVIRYY